MVVISRVAAKSSGLSRYFTGKPCRHGHVASTALALQMIGRGRRHPENAPWLDLVVLDHAGLVLSHGFPNDDREWSLSEKRKREPHKTLRCRQCGALRPFGEPRVCECVTEEGFGERAIDELIGDLVEVTGLPDGCETASAFATRIKRSIKSVGGYSRLGLPMIGRYIHVERALHWLRDRDSGRRERAREHMKSLHKEPEFAAYNRDRAREHIKKLNSDPGFKARMSKRSSERMKALRVAPEFETNCRTRLNERMKALRDDPEWVSRHRVRTSAGIKRRKEAEGVEPC